MLPSIPDRNPQGLQDQHGTYVIKKGDICFSMTREGLATLDIPSLNFVHAGSENFSYNFVGLDKGMRNMLQRLSNIEDRNSFISTAQNLIKIIDEILLHAPLGEKFYLLEASCKAAEILLERYPSRQRAAQYAELLFDCKNTGLVTNNLGIIKACIALTGLEPPELNADIQMPSDFQFSLKRAPVRKAFYLSSAAEHSAQGYELGQVSNTAGILEDIAASYRQGLFAAIQNSARNCSPDIYRDECAEGFFMRAKIMMAEGAFSDALAAAGKLRHFQPDFPQLRGLEAVLKDKLKKTGNDDNADLTIKSLRAAGPI
jgi:hypothetical protein